MRDFPPIIEQGVYDLIGRIRRESSTYRDLTGINDNSTTPAAGQIGEYKSSSVVTGSAVALTTVTGANVTSIVLSAGDWDVWGIVYFKGAGTTTLTYLAASTSLVSATLSNVPGEVGQFTTGAAADMPFGLTDISVNTGPIRQQLSANTTVYLVAQAQFAVSTCSAYGIIQARRRRFYPG